jgi:hypothetical protein
MTAQENMNLIRAWVDAVNRNDVEGELACWQPDGEPHQADYACHAGNGVEASAFYAGIRHKPVSHLHLRH